MIEEYNSPYGYFHDATVSKFEFDNGHLELELKLYNDETQKYDKVKIVFYDVTDLVIDNAPALSISTVYEDGEVLAFNPSKKDVKILIQWNDFKKALNCTLNYSFSFTHFDIENERLTRH